ncbi:MAG: Fic family protein, partial [Sandaracinaceae bacterium]|nr:Fic family protein [Sandaracinaceae bacterium]
MQQQQAQLDQRALHLQKLMEQAPESLRKELADKVELSWIYHESALEGVVYSPDELAQALRGEPPTDPTMVAAFDEIRQNKATIALLRGWAAQKQSNVDADVVKDIYASLAPDEVDGKKPPVYRKDIPLHRLYFHEIAAPDKIVPKLKAFGQWINATETRRTTHVLRLAAKAHFHLLHIYPYPKHSGKVARLVMNLLLLASGYPPAVIHSTERQRYYDALKTNENALAQIEEAALTASIESSIRFLEAKLPPPAPTPIKKIKLISRRRSEPPKATAPTPAPVAAKSMPAPSVPAPNAKPATPKSVAPAAKAPSTKPPAAKPPAEAPSKPPAAKPVKAKA